MSRKLYAVQCDPEYQECGPINDWIETEVSQHTMCLYGNIRCNQHYTSEFQAVLEELYGDCDGLLEALSDLEGYGYDSKRQAVNDYFVPVGNRGEFTDQEIEYIQHILENNLSDVKATIELMTILTGHKWDADVIRGCCQDDWQRMYYDTEMWSSEAIKQFEIEYFNQGSEWCAVELSKPPVAPETIWQEPDCCWYYCHADNLDEIANELRDASGYSSGEVVLYEFKGYKKVALYTEYQNWR